MLRVWRAVCNKDSYTLHTPLQRDVTIRGLEERAAELQAQVAQLEADKVRIAEAEDEGTCDGLAVSRLLLFCFFLARPRFWHVTMSAASISRPFSPIGASSRCVLFISF